MTAEGDLARQLVPPQGEDTGMAQATIVTFDTEDSFENELDYEGLRLTNVPVGSGLEALTYKPGDVVLLRQWFPGGRKGERGLGSVFIERRIIEPGTGAAEKAVAALRTNLARQLSSEVFSDRIGSAEVPSSVGINSATYVSDVDGPSVDVTISSVGLALVGVQAQISIIASISQTNQAYISYRVTGATTRAAVDANAKRTDIGDTDSAAITNVTDQSMSWSIQSGLNEGVNTFESMYRTNFPGSFINRRIIVIGF